MSSQPSATELGDFEDTLGSRHIRPIKNYNFSVADFALTAKQELKRFGRIVYKRKAFHKRGQEISKNMKRPAKLAMRVA